MKTVRLERNIRAGQNLRKIREIMGLQQKELARLAGLQPSQISNLETGVKGIGPKIREKLAQVMGVPDAELGRMLASDGDELRLRLSLAIYRNNIDDLAEPFLAMIELKKMAGADKLSQETWEHLVRQIRILTGLSRAILDSEQKLIPVALPDKTQK